MNDLRKEKESIKRNIEQGVFKTCSKPKSATALWWNTFIRIQDNEENILFFVQCIKCSSILAYNSCKTGSSAQKSHAEICRGNGSAGTNGNQDISVMMKKNNNTSAAMKSSFTEVCAKFCSFDLGPFKVVNGNGFQILCQSLLNLAYQSPHRIEAVDIIADLTTISRRVKSLAEGMLN